MVLHSLFARKVIRLGDKVVKSGPNLQAHEADNLHFIAANTTIPVPRIYDLRGLKGDYIWGANRGKPIIRRLDALGGGPFDSEQEFNDFILADHVQTIPGLLKLYAKHALVDTHEIVFTHIDLVPRNILVDYNARITAVMDWEYSGWYPEY
ncbi:hypothetical protein BJY01DRAFT_260912 [Aspergillus pseudoustus]|uniref:Aminoglycoside phosphotransferase domain-containing protein n=1 Tax=Aspergillus pseudoustus TaxID=1810923 RepID=A0ABR4IRI6_9EURO